jgi:2-oxoglutarate dehydrogenase E1 component
VHTTPKDRVQQQINWQLKVQLLIKSYQTLGHQLAQLDPLCLDKALLDNGSIQPPMVQKLDYKYFGLEEKDLGREVVVEGRPRQTLGQLITCLQHTYCGQVGFEFIHLNSREEREWLTDRIEQEEYWAVD